MENTFIFEEDRVYHLHLSDELKIAVIKENRDCFKRISHWLPILREKGMASPATFVHASTVKAAGLTPVVIDVRTRTMTELSDEETSQYLVAADGTGRFATWCYDCISGQDEGHEPFDFTFVYKKYDNPETFRKQYISMNRDTQPTSSRQVFQLMPNKDPKMDRCNKLVEEGYIDKAAQIICFFRELKRKDYEVAEKGNTIEGIDEDGVKAMETAYKIYSEVFCGKSSLKILHGTTLAFWTKDVLKSSESYKEAVQKIKNGFKSMTFEQLAEIQDAKGVKGDKSQTTAIILNKKFNNLLK